MKTKPLDVTCPTCRFLLTPTSDRYAVCERCDGKLIPLTVGQMDDLEAAIEERRQLLRLAKQWPSPVRNYR